MWTHQYCVEVDELGPEKIWACYRDVSNWSSWDTELKSSLLKGAFTEGASIEIQPTKGPKVLSTIITCVENKKLTVRTKLPLKTMMTFDHVIEKTDRGISVCHRIEIAGPLTFLFRRVIGRSVEHHFPIAIKCLIEKAKVR